MHELPVIKSILDICLRYAKANEVSKIISIELKIGELSDLVANFGCRVYTIHVARERGRTKLVC